MAVTVRVDTPKTMVRFGMAMVEVTEAPDKLESSSSATTMSVAEPASP